MANRFIKPPLRHFVDPRLVGPDGLVGVTARITPELLLEAYSHGIFPWSDRPARWYCPDPRAIFDLETTRFSHRLERVVRQERFRVSFDQAFETVMASCWAHHRHQAWIAPSMLDPYRGFHDQGYAHSVEVWEDAELVGGLYGVQIRGFFAGESMFFRRKDASKVAFVMLVRKLQKLGVTLLDSQVLNPHTKSLGAFEVTRGEYLERLEQALLVDCHQQSWLK